VGSRGTDVKLFNEKRSARRRAAPPKARSTKARRAAKAVARHSQPEKTVFVHEAGHCVGRVLVARSSGWDIYEAIYSIDIPPNSEATTWGPLFSKPMEEFLRARMPEKFKAESLIPPADLQALASEMRAAGIDVTSWFRAKSIELILGPMAEAKHLSKPFEDVWNAETSKDDRRNVVRAGYICGMNVDLIVQETDRSIGIVENLMTTLPELWHAISALADTLKFGSNNGRKAVDVITATLMKSGAILQLEL
jgi:hypothetical protein